MPDAPALADLLTQLGYPTSPASMEGRLANILPHPDYLTLVAEADGRVVGMIGATIEYAHEMDGRIGQIIALVVDEGYRNRGIGAVLLAECERWLRERGADLIIVTSNKRRVDAHRFYERLGYDGNGLRFSKRFTPK